MYTVTGPPVGDQTAKATSIEVTPWSVAGRRVAVRINFAVGWAESGSNARA